MKFIKRTAAILLALVLCFSLIGCHPKNEVALTIGDTEFTSAFYSCALIQAIGEGRSEVETALSEKNESTANIDYFKQKIDGKSFTKWVEERTIEICRVFAYVKKVCEENNIVPDESELNMAKSYAESYWLYYGYADAYTQCGISLDTYKDFFTYTVLLNTHFESIYGENGTSAIPESEIKSNLSEKYILADVLKMSLDDGTGKLLPDESINMYKEKFEGYKTRLEAGEDFATIYVEQNGEAEEQAESEEEKPEDPYAQIFGAEDTGDYATKYYNDLKDIAVGDVKLINDEDEGMLLLLKKKDILGDPYYFNSMRDYIVNALKYDDYTADMKKASADMKINKNNYAIKNFGVKKISKIIEG